MSSNQTYYFDKATGAYVPTATATPVVANQGGSDGQPVYSMGPDGQLQQQSHSNDGGNPPSYNPQAHGPGYSQTSDAFFAQQLQQQEYSNAGHGAPNNSGDNRNNHSSGVTPQQAAYNQSHGLPISGQGERPQKSGQNHQQHQQQYGNNQQYGNQQFANQQQGYYNNQQPGYGNNQQYGQQRYGQPQYGQPQYGNQYGGRPQQQGVGTGTAVAAGLGAGLLCCCCEDMACDGF